jgi:hypothetical protein
MDPRELMTLRDYEIAFERSATEGAAAFVSTGASEGTALRANQAAFDGLQLLPRSLVDVSRRSMRTTLLGHALFDVPYRLRILPPRGLRTHFGARLGVRIVPSSLRLPGLT